MTWLGAFGIWRQHNACSLKMDTPRALMASISTVMEVWWQQQAWMRLAAFGICDQESLFTICVVTPRN